MDAYQLRVQSTPSFPDLIMAVAFSKDLFCSIYHFLCFSPSHWITFLNEELLRVREM